MCIIVFARHDDIQTLLIKSENVPVNVGINVTLRRVRTDTVTVEKQ